MKQFPSFWIAVFASGAAIFAGASEPSFAHGAEDRSMQAQAKRASTATPIFERLLPNIPGKSLVAVELV